MTKEIKKNRNLIGLVKEKHSEILDIEEKIYFVSSEIKKRKAEGLSGDELRKKEENKR